MRRIDESQRGFTIPEMLVAMVLIVAVGIVALATVQALVRAIGQRSSSPGGTVALEDQLEEMRADAATAYSVFVPERDVYKKYNASAPGLGVIPSGHEVDFYARTDTGLESWWAYYYNADAQTLQRFDYDAAGTIGVADRNTGVIDAASSYPVLSGVTTFSAQVLEAGQLTNASNRFAPLIAGLFSGDAAPQSDPVGIVPASNVSRSDLYGGNITVQVEIGTAHGARTLHLQSAAMPSGFTVHQTPSIRAVTYRIDVVHRFWFGFAQITHSQIFNQLLYSYDPSAPADQWKVWCDWELYGSDIAGLRLSDPHVNYLPHDFNESAPGIFYAVTNTDAKGNGTSGLNELPGCHHPVPGPTASFAPVPVQTDPDVNDTPPPCFDAGQCWPYNAPSNYTPPSPWPSSSPPAAWCATHAESPLCGGAGGTPEPISSAPIAPVYSPPSKPPIHVPINPHSPLQPQ